MQRLGNIRAQEVFTLVICGKYAEQGTDSTSASIFAKAGISNMSTKTKCIVLNKMTIKLISRLPKNENHEKKRIGLTEKYVKNDFKLLLFMNEARATLDRSTGA